MPVWLAEFLGALLRWLLMLALAPLVSKAIIPQEIADKVVAYGVPTILAWIVVLVPLAWSWFQKWRARKVKLMALEMPPGTSEKDLEAEARKSISKHIPPGVSLFILAVLLSAATVAAAGCRTFTLPSSAAEVANAKQAAKAGVILGDTYETSMGILVELRAAGHISDSAWAEIDDAQRKVNLYGPKLVTAVELWQKFGSRSSFDAVYDDMKAVVDRVAEMRMEVAR